MTKTSLNRVRQLSALVAATTLLAACGGGSSDAAPPPPAAGPPPPAATVTITGKAVDGALQGAMACYDVNDNKACDGTDPTSTATGADGAFSIAGIAAADVGKHAVVVNVPASAIDADTGSAVGVAFTLVAPATGTTTAHSVFVSPLTTLVQRQMEGVGQSLAQATDFIKTQLGLAVSPLADFTAATNADNTLAANAARLVVATQRQQATDVALAVGQADLSGSTVTQANVDAAVAKAVVGALPSIGAAAGSATLNGKSGPDLNVAVAALATTIVAQIGLTVPELVTTVGIAKLPPDPPMSEAPTAGASLSALRYTSASNWYMRHSESSVADNTLVNGLYRYTDVRTRTETYNYAAGSPVSISWGFNNDPARAGDLWWSGSAWEGCPLGTRNTSTPRDASGRNSYSYCNSFEKGTSVRSALDISGQTLSSVLTQKIRTVAGGSGGVNFADWGPADLSLLGSATFPTGSKLFYQTSTPLESAIAYDVQAASRVTVYTQAVADGGDARANGGIACAAANLVPVAASTLEEVVARSPGKPCVFNLATNADGSSLDPNEAWFATALSMGNVQGYFATLPAGTGNFYTNLARMRVSFTGNANGTVYYACYERRTNPSTRNCQAVGTGTYTVATLGDARVMTFNNVPAQLQRTNFARVMVERGGKVYNGYKNPVGVDFASVRLNMTAANALLRQLNLPVILPSDAPQALTGAKATNQELMKGVWYFSDAFGTGLLRVGDNGEYVLATTDAPSATERPGYERGWLDVDGQGKLNRLIALDTDGADGLSHHDPSATISVTDTSFTFTLNGVTEGFDGRLPDSGTGVVGMWALGSPTDLKVTQFVFFGNGKVLSIHPAETAGACATARQGPPGIEWSDYSFNATTGALRIFNKIYDTSGCTGAFDSADAVPNTEVNLVLTIATDGKTATSLGDDGVTVLTFHRITPNP